MNWQAECVVVIPCLNEEATIGGLASAVRRHLQELIVVDDGSSDQTPRLAKAAGAEVIQFPHTRGKGSALDAGWRRARERNFSWVLMLDGDGQHAPEDIPAFLSAAELDGADLIIGNRMNDTGNMPWLRRRINQVMSLLLSRAAGVSLPDTQCGFRLMRLSAWTEVSLVTSHFEIESEVLLKFLAQNFKVSFVPIRTIYNGESSKINPLRDTMRWLRWWRSARQIQKKPQLVKATTEPSQSLRVRP